MTEANVFRSANRGAAQRRASFVGPGGQAEAAALLASHADNLTEDGRRRLVRHGHLPEREVMTGIGPVAVRCPRVRDRVGEGSERIRFSSAILPPYARRSVVSTIFRSAPGDRQRVVGASPIRWKESSPAWAPSRARSSVRTAAKRR